jgi:N-methylhydantoinase B/oxoprolinase/acetone carboxylase alpha subunit
MTDPSTRPSLAGLPRWKDNPPVETDPVTLAVIQGYLEATCREMGTSLVRNALSPIFIEGQDFSCAILDADRQLVAAANYDPSHLCSMAYAADWAVLELGPEKIGPADVVVLNDPYRGGSHVGDVTMFRPVYFEGALIGYVITRAHHLDLGGASPGSIPGGFREIYAEGLRIPPVRWIQNGEEVGEVLEFILSNVRLPSIQVKDLRAQLASLNTAEARLVRLCDKYGPEIVVSAIGSLLDQSEIMMRSVIEEIPDGSYEFEDFMDDDGVRPEHYRIRVRVEVAGSEALVDFSGTSVQAEGAINSPYAMTASSTFNAFLQIAGPDVPFNHGCFRPVRIVAPRRSLVNPEPPGPTFGCTTDTPLRIIDCITGALAQAIPERIIAGSYGTCNCLAGMGENRSGDEFIFWFFYEGGWGAARYRDGWNSTPNQSANFLNYPVEIIESQYPLICRRVELRPDSGGSGRHRGGLGTVHEIEFDTQTVLSGFGDRHVMKPYGLFSGQAGAPNGFEFIAYRAVEGQPIETPTSTSGSKFANFIVKRGECIRILNGGGGGYGSPLERIPEAVLGDVRDGLVSEQSANEDYGVVVLKGDSSDWIIDLDATSRRRAELTAKAARDQVGYDEVSLAIRAGKRPVREPAPPDLLGEKVREALAGFEWSYCRSTCPKLARAELCPLYKEEALAFWSAYAFQQWVRRHCPLKENLAGRLPA